VLVTEPATPRTAATLMLARDSADGLEVFMVVRHHEIEFAPGALVFPGGSASARDADPRWRRLADGADQISDEMLSVMAAAAREAFEECGVLFARTATRGPLLDGTRAEALGATYRQAIEAGSLSFADMIELESLFAAFDRLVHFAHWITPPHMPKRFDTHFFLAEAPLDHLLRHDGRESVDSVWVTPRQACEDADAGRHTILFPTRLNLEKVGQHRTVAEALGAARASRIVTVRPEASTAEGGRLLRIPIEAGYGAGEFLVSSGSGKNARIHKLDAGTRSS
jgi:8-oxo-dGTP pyrophosphatase MutT (NUDIX family)